MNDDEWFTEDPSLPPLPPKVVTPLWAKVIAVAATVIVVSIVVVLAVGALFVALRWTGRQL